MASFDDLYRMQQALNNPGINIQQQQVRMPNWLTAPTPPSQNLGGTQLLLNQMNRVGDLQRRDTALDQDQQALDIQRQKASDLADIQMRTFQAKLAQQRQAQQARQNYAESSPEFAAAIMAGEDPSDFQRKMASVGGDPVKYREIYGPGSGVSVNVGGEQTEEQKVVGKAYGKDYVDLQRAGREAYKDTSKLGQLDTLLDETYTGAGGKQVLAAKKLANALGMDMEGIGEAEAGMAISSELALQLRNPAGGAGMPGAMSDKDREFLQSMVPGLAMTADGRKLLIDTKRKLNKRTIDVAKMARDYRRENGSLDEGFFDELAAYGEDNPMFEQASDSGDLSEDEMMELQGYRKTQGY